MSINAYELIVSFVVAPNFAVIKYRNLVIDLGNGVKTKAQLTLPTVGKGPFPGVLLIHGSVVLTDKNGTLGFVHREWS